MHSVCIEKPDVTIKSFIVNRTAERLEPPARIPGDVAITSPSFTSKPLRRQTDPVHEAMNNRNRLTTHCFSNVCVLTGLPRWIQMWKRHLSDILLLHLGRSRAQPFVNCIFPKMVPQTHCVAMSLLLIWHRNQMMMMQQQPYDTDLILAGAFYNQYPGRGWWGSPRPRAPSPGRLETLLQHWSAVFGSFFDWTFMMFLFLCVHSKCSLVFCTHQVIFPEGTSFLPHCKRTRGSSWLARLLCISCLQYP